MWFFWKPIGAAHALPGKVSFECSSSSLIFMWSPGGAGLVSSGQPMSPHWQWPKQGLKTSHCESDIREQVLVFCRWSWNKVRMNLNDIIYLQIAKIYNVLSRPPLHQNLRNNLHSCLLQSLHSSRGWWCFRKLGFLNRILLSDMQADLLCCRWFWKEKKEDWCLTQFKHSTRKA